VQERLDAMSFLKAAHKTARIKVAAAATGKAPEVVIARTALVLNRQRLAQSRAGTPVPRSAHRIGKIDLSTATAEQRAQAQTTIGPMAAKLQELRAAVKECTDKPDRLAAQPAAKQARVDAVATLQAIRKEARERLDATVGRTPASVEERKWVINARLALQLYLQTTNKLRVEQANLKKARADKVDFPAPSPEQHTGTTVCRNDCLPDGHSTTGTSRGSGHCH
jgi:hypothetical protein